MSLPLELLDNIFGYLPPDDRDSLRVCSLVAKPWVWPARRRLFSSVVITEWNYESWKDTISPVNAELLSHVRSLEYFIWSRTSPGWEPPLINGLFDYLPSFHHLQILVLSNMRINSDISEQVEVFSAFRHSLSSLSFQTLILTWSAFITLVDYFPNATDLDVKDPIWEIDHRQPPPLSRPLRGRLSIDMYEYQALPIFSDRLSGLEVEYDELLILGISNPWPSTDHYHQYVVDTCRKTLKRLKLSPCSLDAPMTLSHCPELRRLEMMAPGKRERTVISSITSTNLRTIAFLPDTVGFTLHTLADSPSYWKPLDDVVCELVDKLCTLGYDRTLELEFPFKTVAFDDVRDFRSFLPKFREKGRVKILETSSGKVFEVAGNRLPGELLRQWGRESS